MDCREPADSMVCMTIILGLGPQGPMVTEVINCSYMAVDLTYCSKPLCKRLNILEGNCLCLAVHEKTALWVMGASHSEGHQGTAYHPALRHAQDVPEISQSPLSDRTQQVGHWGCVPIVLASDGMQASAVEAVDTAHHCSSQRPCLGRMCQCRTVRVSPIRILCAVRRIVCLLYVYYPDTEYKLYYSICKYNKIICCSPV